jgi:hypothetical protein
MYEGDAVPESVQKWAVTPLAVSRTKRYLDPAVANKFWAALDQYILVKRPYLLPKGASSAATPATAGGAAAGVAGRA